MNRIKLSLRAMAVAALVLVAATTGQANHVSPSIVCESGSVPGGWICEARPNLANSDYLWGTSGSLAVWFVSGPIIAVYCPTGTGSGQLSLTITHNGHDATTSKNLQC